MLTAPSEAVLSVLNVRYWPKADILDGIASLLYIKNTPRRGKDEACDGLKLEELFQNHYLHATE